MRKIAALTIVFAAALGLGSCSGGDGSAYCNKARDLTKTIGSKAKFTVDEGRAVAAGYRDMAKNLPKDMVGATAKDLEDVALVIQATYVDKNPASAVGKVDITRLKATLDSVRTYNTKHCDIVYPKAK